VEAKNRGAFGFEQVTEAIRDTSQDDAFVVGCTEHATDFQDGLDLFWSYVHLITLPNGF
jgi:hypothetical protein